MLKKILELLYEYSDRTGELYLISFYPHGDGFVLRDRPKESDYGDYTERILFKFENLQQAKTLMKEQLNDLDQG